jgi:hypothetical protein
VIKAIVTTTINPPTKALQLFAAKKDWDLIIVGDLITPHEEYRKFERVNKNVTYFSPVDQDKKFPKLSKAIGWRKIQRRNIGYVEAYERGAEIIATVDDDNILNDDWGKNLFVGEKIKVNFYKTNLSVFDPVGATNHKEIWHRGFPLQLVSKRKYSKPLKKEIKADIQADFWDGDPDIDAVCRMIFAPECKFNKRFFPLASNKISPFNSQNTFLTREVLKNYFLFPFVGRMDDIWAAFYVQALGFKVVFGRPTVYQDRNVHNLTRDMKDEYLGYENNLEIVETILKDPNKINNFLPKKAIKAFEIYRKCLD